MTGHTENDQIETFLMRKARSGHCEARGLAAMSPRSLLEGSVKLARPLLTVSRQALRDELTRRGIAWVDDPSNANIDYERPRVRLGVAAEADGQEVLEQIAQAGAARERDNAALVEALADPATLGVDAAGMMFLNADCYAALSPGARQLFSGLLASIAGGGGFCPVTASVAVSNGCCRGRMHPAALRFWRPDRAWGEGAPHRFRRERRNLPKLDLVPGQHIVWDGRFCFSIQGQKF